MRTVGYIPEEGAEQEKELVTEQGGTPITPEIKDDGTGTPVPPEPPEPKDDGTGTPATPEPPADTSSTTPPADTGKKGGKKE